MRLKNFLFIQEPLEFNLRHQLKNKSNLFKIKIFSKKIFRLIYKNFQRLFLRPSYRKIFQKLFLYLDSLETLYDNRIVNFGQENYVLGLKGSDMIKHSFSDLDRAFIYLRQSVEGQQAKSKAGALFSYFKAAFKKYQANSLDKAQLLEVYATVSDYLDVNISKDSKSKKFYVNAAENVEKLFSNVANCDELTAMFDSKYQETPKSINLLKRIVKVLDKKDCTDAEVYFFAAKQLHEIEPSALSAYNMGNLAIKKNKSYEASNKQPNY